ncbi:Protein CFT1 [Pseudozyma hubeiensis]|nr:Protein CFT1 [Pseudozyma hubeiensis]
MASGYHHQELAPAGYSHAVFLNLHYHSPAPSTSQQTYQHRGRLQTQLVTARDDLLTIYDVYDRSQTPASAASALSTVNVNGLASSSSADLTASHRLVVVRKHDLFGSVTGLQRVETLASDKDRRDRLLVSFKDAKLALLEWNDITDDLETVSIHTYERAPQLLNGTPHLFHPLLRVDPLSRCAALLLPHDSLAILPFYRDEADFDFDLDDDLGLVKDDAAAVAAAAAAGDMESLPYSPSFVLTMREVDPKIRNLKHFCFLPGFQKPTVAVLFSHTPTWTGMLAERKDSFSVYLFTLDLSASLDGTTLSSAADAFDDGTIRSAHPVVTTSSALPHDCLYMVPCPQTLGGVVVVCMSSVLHVDQSGRVVVTALNQWFKVTSAIEPESVLEARGIADLQGSQLVFTSETQGVLTLVDGDMYRFRCQMDGRSVEGFRLERMQESSVASQELTEATAPPPSCLAVSLRGDNSTSITRTDTSAGLLFNASMAGDSALYSLIPVKKPLAQNGNGEADDDLFKAEAAPTSNNDMDLDLDDDLYGTSDAIGSAGTKAKVAAKDQTVLAVRKVDEILSYGGLHSIARRKLAADESGSSKRHGLVGACGSGNQAGLVYLDPRFVPEARTKLVPATLEDKQQVEDQEDTTPVFSKAFVVGRGSEGDVRMIASREDDESSIGFSTPAQVRSTDATQHRASWTEIKHFTDGTTICAGALAGSGVVARVTATSLQVLSLDSFDVLNETVVIAPGQGSILYASLDAEQYAVVHISDGATLLYGYDVSGRKFESIDVSVAFGESSTILSANVFRDVYGHLERARRTTADGNASAKAAPATKAAIAKPRAITSLPDDEEVDYGEEDDTPPPTHAANGDSKHVNGSTIDLPPAYLFALDSAGTIRIHSLPTLELVWSNSSLAAQPQRLRYERSGHAELAPEQKAVLTMAVAQHIGDMLCVVSVTVDHFVSVWRSNPWGADGEEGCGLTFNKVLVKVLAAPGGGRSFEAEDGDAGVGFRSGVVQLDPFTVRARGEDAVGSNAIAVLGGGREVPASVLCWTEKGGFRLLDWPEGDLTCLSTIPAHPAQASADEADYVYTDRRGHLYLAHKPRNLHSSTSWPSTVIRTGRSYTHVVSHSPTSSIIASSISPCRFVLFDEDGEPIPDSSPATVGGDVSYRGSIELFIEGEVVDGYEFEANETVSALRSVILDSPSTASGRKEFIAVGTTTFHGEDRTAKGSVYLFEVIEVVGGGWRVKLVCRDDSRAPVTAISSVNGYLMSTCGQKLFVRALEKEEWLISIAFLDCPFYITDVKVVKNLVILSDAKRGLGVWVFQEEPFKFIELARGEDGYAGLGEVLVREDKVSFVELSGSKLGGGVEMEGGGGVVRLYEYQPESAAGGQKLILKCEYATTAEATSSTSLAGRWLSDSELRGRETLRNKLLMSKANGAVESIAAVDDKVSKRLHLLQGQLARSVLHVAALNPRSFRAVRNDNVARALVRGVLDARLLAKFEEMSRPKMGEVVKRLVGMWDGLDDVSKMKRGDARKRKVEEVDGDDEKREEEGRNGGQDREEEDDEEGDLGKLERLRLQSEQKRVQLVLKDLSRLRLGFEQV